MAQEKIRLKLNWGEIAQMTLPAVEAEAHRIAARASAASGEVYEVVSGMNVRGKAGRRPHAGVGGDYLHEIETEALQRALGGGL